MSRLVLPICAHILSPALVSHSRFSALICRATIELKILEQNAEGIATGRSWLALDFAISRCTMQIKSEFGKRQLASRSCESLFAKLCARSVLLPSNLLR